MFSSFLYWLCGALLDLLFPRNDLLMNRPVGDDLTNGRYLDNRSFRYLVFLDHPLCNRCGFPLSGKAESSDSCQRCSHLEKVYFDGNRSILMMNRLSRRLIHELKYNNGRYLKTDFEAIFQESDLNLAEWIQDSFLVPVPLHEARQHKRGFNQSEFFAKLIRDQLNEKDMEVIPLLERIKNSSSQTRLDRKQRISNVRNSFQMNNRVKLPKQKRIVIVDDVFTTGSTVNECARVLAKSGFKEIRVLTIGHG